MQIQCELLLLCVCGALSVVISSLLFTTLWIKGLLSCLIKNHVHLFRSSLEIWDCKMIQKWVSSPCKNHRKYKYIMRPM